LRKSGKKHFSVLDFLLASVRFLDELVRSLR
jgi:hypothetical protein